MDLRHLVNRLRKWPAESPEGELRSLPASAQFAMLWPLAVVPQGEAPSWPAGALLLRLNPPCPLGCSEAVASMVHHGWDVSIEEVPWYLVKQFGRRAVVAAADEGATRSSSDTERAVFRTVVYWANLFKDAG